MPDGRGPSGPRTLIELLPFPPDKFNSRVLPSLMNFWHSPSPWAAKIMKGVISSTIAIILLAYIYNFMVYRWLAVDHWQDPSQRSWWYVFATCLTISDEWHMFMGKWLAYFWCVLTTAFLMCFMSSDWFDLLVRIQIWVFGPVGGGKERAQESEDRPTSESLPTQTHVTSAEVECATLKGQLDEAYSKITSLEQDLGDAQRESEAAGCTTRQGSAKLEVIQRQLSESELKHTSLREDLKKTQAELLESKQENTFVRKELEDIQRRPPESLQETMPLQEQLDKTQERLSESTQENEALQKRVRAAESQAIEADRRAERARRDFHSMMAKTLRDKGKLWNIPRLYNPSNIAMNDGRVRTIAGLSNRLELRSEDGRGSDQMDYTWVFGPGAKTSQLSDLVCTAIVYGITTPAMKHIALVMDGQSGGGKSFTLHGDRNGSILSTLATRLFQDVDSLDGVRCAAVELYMDGLYDLLRVGKKGTNVSAPKELFDSNVGEVECRDAQGLQNVVQQARKRMHRQATNYNKESSRGHVVYRLTFTAGGEPRIIDLFDLTGREDMGAIVNLGNSVVLERQLKTNNKVRTSIHRIMGHIAGTLQRVGGDALHTRLEQVLTDADHIMNICCTLISPAGCDEKGSDVYDAARVQNAAYLDLKDAAELTDQSKKKPKQVKHTA